VRVSLRLVAANLAVFVVLVELLGLLVFYYQHGWLYYAYPFGPRGAPAAVSAVGEPTLTREGLHPYFGPTHAPGIVSDLAPDMATNNFGFVARSDYPVADAGDQQVLVGILGGSVGAWFCQVGTTRLVEALAAGSQYFAAREIVPVCLSHEGYKQPQQALVLSYFLTIGQAFDLVVNIDGFNEVALGRINTARGFDVSMPSAMHLETLVALTDRATLTPERLASLAAIARDRARLDALGARVDATPSAAVNLVLDAWYRRVAARYQAEVARFEALPGVAADGSLIRVTPSVRPLGGDALYETIAGQWAEGSRVMHALLAARGVPYLHVLQPNQYVGARAISAAVALVALLEASPFRVGAMLGSPFLLEALGGLRAAGVSAVDGTGVFDDEPALVYIDNCCHYTQRGNDLLAEFIAREVLALDGAPW
jgi:hypothetical protein